MTSDSPSTQPLRTEPPPSQQWLWKTDDSKNDTDCNLAMLYIRQLNECRGECAIVHNISKPLVHWAIMGGQGMGRFIDNAVYTCLRAASLGRPCLVDSTVRDPFFTLRSFLSMQLDVDVLEEAQEKGDQNGFTFQVFSKTEALELKHAISRLKHGGSGHWTMSDFSPGVDLTTRYKHVLPLIESTEEEESSTESAVIKHSQSTMLERIINQSNRIVISPSWGPPSLWTKNTKYESIPPAQNTVSQNNVPFSCQRGDDRLVTKLQNYMFRPTRLAKELLKAYKRRVLLGSNSSDTINAVEHLSYGSIHIRFHILRTTYKAFPPIDADKVKIHDAIHDMAAELWKRLVKEKKKYLQELQGIKHWWIVSDNMDYSQLLANFLNVMATEARSDLKFVTDGLDRSQEKQPATNDTGIAGGIDDVLNRILEHRRSSSKTHHVKGSREGTIHHSVDPGATGPLGHELLATSIVDWMVLHESHCSVTTIGSFSASGARGRNKIPINPDRAKYRFYLNKFPS
ncbi:hypothetical protein IV203_037311 [Nitzschia inconspicua]|uniref:Uncharacterized protein n=1 Tax=Nitzschia inconspicua TaxID=303405 RepID=A0A9K3Q0W1_9STRA|nr:hypothetical protein IV203_006345 [Nitzschia inconspicua]KAG7364109.1 hypothetical protein IV203_037311 [Nitzschia inconspicua]